MIVNKDVEIKFYYRFIEFTSKLLGVDLPHERLKLIILDNFKAESTTEKKVKDFAEAYLYLINNVNQSLTTTVINKAYYLLTNKMINEDACKNILEQFYKHYDETSHYSAALIHFSVLENVVDRKIEFAFMMSNLVMLKKKRNPFIPYEFVFEKYLEVIDSKDINKLLYIFAEIEANLKPRYFQGNLTQEQIIREIKKNKTILINKFNVNKLYLYGSYAKEKTTFSSDLDLLVIFDKELLNFERCINNSKLIEFFESKLKITIDLIDFSHAIDDLDINEMENIITII